MLTAFFSQFGQILILTIRDDLNNTLIKYENSEQATKAMNSDYSSTEFSKIQISYFFSSISEDQKEIEVVWTDGSNKIYESEEAKEKRLQVEWKWD